MTTSSKKKIIIKFKDKETFAIFIFREEFFQFFSNYFLATNDCETLSCESGWKKASIDGNERCFKSLGAFPFGQIGSVCQQHNAVVPLPRNEREDQDFNTLFKSFGLRYAILGATDLQQERDL